MKEQDKRTENELNEMEISKMPIIQSNDHRYSLHLRKEWKNSVRT